MILFVYLFNFNCFFVVGESVADTSTSSPDMTGPISPCKLEIVRSSPDMTGPVSPCNKLDMVRSSPDMTGPISPCKLEIVRSSPSPSPVNR